MVVNFVRMSFSSLSFVVFQITNQNLGESIQMLMFNEDITLHLQSKMDTSQTFTRSDEDR